MTSNIQVVDLFCGIGGLSHGFLKEGFEVVAGFDNDPTCKYAYETNNKAVFHCKDIREVKVIDVKKCFEPSAKKILIGCAPCQPFSNYNQNKILQDNEKTELLYDFLGIIIWVAPEIVVMENVPQLADSQKTNIFSFFCSKLEEYGYKVNFRIINCAEYGIPQNRKRLVLIASKEGDIKLIDETHCGNFKTVRDTISHLPPIAAGEICKTDPLHQARRLTEKNLKRIKATTEGGSWNNWEDDLKLDCHKKKSGKSYGSVYGRMKWDEPAPTMTTHCTGLGNGRFGHPEQDRAISMREAALFQTFPNEFQFFEGEKCNVVDVCRHIGNAVPVELGQVIAKSIKIFLGI